jgi:Fe-S-cluster containining protein
MAPANTRGFAQPAMVRFKCTRCALCCGDTRTRTRHVLLLEHEARRISEITSEPVETFAREIRGREPYVYEMRKTKKTRKCHFLRDKTCTVYRVRPLVCRFYPFELKKERDSTHRFVCTVECPGVGRGKRLERQYFQGLLERAREQFDK